MSEGSGDEGEEGEAGGQFNRIIENLFENLFEILVPENLIEKYFLVLKSQTDFQIDFHFQ